MGEDIKLESAVQLLTETMSCVSTANIKPMIAVIGISEAGKSSVINAMLGNTLNPTCYLLDAVKLSPTLRFPGPKIGFGYGSETTFPAVYSSPKFPYALLDTAGDFDTRKEAHQLNAEFGRQLAIRNAHVVQGIVFMTNAINITGVFLKGLEAVQSLEDEEFPEII